MYICKHCNKQVPSLDDVPIHDCFIGKTVFLEDENNVLFYAEDKQMSYQQSIKNGGHNTMQLSEESNKEHAIWDRNAILALISLYETNIEMMDHPKKKGKVWEAIRIGLLTFGIKMTNDQVRWKINALVKRYREVVDNNSKSGRARMDFEWYKQLVEILGSRQHASTGHTVSSKLLTSATCTSTSEKEYSSESSLIETSSSKLIVSKNDCINSSVTSVKNKRSSHCETGSKTATTKIELEKQWLHHLQRKDERDHIKDQRNIGLLEAKKEALKLKKRQLDLKEIELEQRKEIATKKAKEKKTRHMELLEVEQLKYELLKKLVEDKENVHKISDSD